MTAMGPLPSATPGATCLTPQERAIVVRFRSDNGASIAGAVLGTGRRIEDVVGTRDLTLVGAVAAVSTRQLLRERIGRDFQIRDRL
jgi:hypothetical protein